MELTPLQLEIQQWSDHNVGFGCIMEVGGDYLLLSSTSYSYYRLQESDGTEYHDYLKDKVKVIGHPMDWGRISYLYHMLGEGTEEGEKMYDYFDEHPMLYNQTVLERPVELQKYVRDFLLSLPSNE